jgi:uncharacterized protein
MKSPASKRLSRRRWLLHGLWLTPVAAVGDALAVEPGWIRKRKIRIGSGRIGKRFAHFTDVHFKGDSEQLESVVEIVNDAAVDFAVFTGDLIEEEALLEPALSLLGRIRVPLYGIPGNHDHWSGADFSPFRETFAATGGRWLQDESVTLADAPIRIVGKDSLDGAAETAAGVFNLLLVHYPAWADALAERNPGRRFDLMLAGHTHGGQVRLPFVGPLVTPFDTGRYDMGWFETAAGPLYVNPGIGTFYVDVRFNCRPEVTVFEI